MSLVSLINEGKALMNITRKGTEYRVTLRVRSDDRAFLEQLQSEWGGKIARASDGAWWWNLRQSRVFDALRQTVKSLHGVGQQKASLVLRLSDSIDNNQRVNPGVSLSPLVIKLRDDLSKQLKKLNRQGV